MERLEPFPIERVMSGYWIFAGLVVLDTSEANWFVNEILSRKRLSKLQPLAGTFNSLVKRYPVSS